MPTWENESEPRNEGSEFQKEAELVQNSPLGNNVLGLVLNEAPSGEAKIATV